MTTDRHTIDDLFSDSGPIDESAVVEAIGPFITIQNSTNEIFFKESGLTGEQMTLAYGLAKKLLRKRGLINKELITAVEVHKKTGIKKGTIDPIFKRLKEKGFLVGKKEYEIPDPKITQIIKSLRQKA